MMGRPYTIRLLTQAHQMKALEDVQVAAWGYAEREVLPGTMLRISAATGGIVLGAYPEGSDVPFGLAYSFPAYLNGQPGHPPELWHHSHLLAVAPEWRGSGAAVALKLAQAQAAREQGHARMTWTFDPLIARNARLNLGKLGARAISYHPDWYDLGGPVPSDRLMIEWDLTRGPVERSTERPDGVTVLETVGAEPGMTELDETTSPLLAEVPTTAETLPTELRLRWRLALRAVLGGYLAQGYVVTGLARRGERAWYVLERG
jgi:predicted GNAT superfamily acetyltransferase